MSQSPIAIVTGGGRGIGRAISISLAKAGCDILAVYASDGSAAQNTMEEVIATGRKGHTVQADVATDEGRHRILTAAKEHFGRCDMLVNNAGIAPEKRGDLLDVSQESFDRLIDVNLKGTFFLIQMTSHWMIEQHNQFPDRRFRIINIGSISAYTSSTSRGEYCISKAGAAMTTQLFADRLAEFGIGVFEIRPGIIATDMTAGVKDKYDKLIAEGLTPIRRWGRPEDVASVAVAIAEGRLDFCTGQVINADGGFHMRRL